MTTDTITTEIEIDAKTLTIAMQKGGVGKSATAIGLSGALADDTDRTVTDGNDVLLVDGDPQGFVTIMFGYADYYTGDEALTLYDVLMDVDEGANVDELVIDDHPEVDVLPSHGRNFLLEKELWNESRTQKRLGLALSNLSKSYDYIIIDSPPNLGPLADGAILAAENVMYASKPDEIASFSMNLLLNEIRSLEKEFGVDVGDVGAAVNMVGDDNVSAQRVEWFKETLGENNVTVFPDSVAVEGAIGQSGSAFNPEYVPDNRHREQKASELRDLYDQLAQRVEGHYA